MKDLTMITKLMMQEKRDIVYSILFGFIAGMATVLLFSASGYLISKAALTPPLYTLTIVIAAVKLLSFVRAFSRYGERYFSHRATFTILNNLRVSFFERLEPLAPGIFQKYRSGDLLARIVGDIESLQNFFLRVFYPPIVLIIVFLSTILFTLYFSASAGVVLFAGLLLTTFVIPALVAIRQRRINSAVREKRGGLSTALTEFLYGFRDLKIYQKLSEKEEQLMEASDTYVSEQEQENRTILFSQSVNVFISLLVTWVILAMGAYFVVQGELDGVFLAMLVMISITVFEDASPMAVFPIHYNDNKRAAKRLYSVVQGEAYGETLTTDDVALTTAPAIEVRDVDFMYEGEWRKTLESICLDIPAGSKTAIVGPSGSGKSALLQLLLKIHPVDGGTIYYDGIAFDELHQAAIWKNTKVVLQENHFFYGTIRDNLLLAGEQLTDNALQAMLGKVKLASFSLDDHVSERGENLSGGEKQRLAIARAMLKGGHLWVLDEPTSSIDAVTEKMIYQHLFDQAKEDTLILVSHRLTGLEKMDQIIVMDQGRVVETGTYAALMESRGYFYRMKEIEPNLF